MAKRTSRLHAIPMPTDERESMSVTRIKNGWLIAREGTRKGKYFSEREFSAEKPVLQAAPTKAGRR